MRCLVRALAGNRGPSRYARPEWRAPSVRWTGARNPAGTVGAMATSSNVERPGNPERLRSSTRAWIPGANARAAWPGRAALRRLADRPLIAFDQSGASPPSGTVFDTESDQAGLEREQGERENLPVAAADIDVESDGFRRTNAAETGRRSRGAAGSASRRLLGYARKEIRQACFVPTPRRGQTNASSAMDSTSRGDSAPTANSTAGSEIRRAACSR